MTGVAPMARRVAITGQGNSDMWPVLPDWSSLGRPAGTHRPGLFRAVRTTVTGSPLEGACADLCLSISISLAGDE